MENILVLCQDKPIRTLSLSADGLEIGHASSCDFVIADDDIAARHLLVRADPAGHVIAFDLVRGISQRLEWGHTLPIGERYSVRRCRSTEPLTSPTETIALASGAESELFVTVAGGRRLFLRARALNIGTHSCCELRLSDRAVSQMHCRIEPADGEQWVIRDLSSRNGTYVDGVRTEVAHIGAGTRIRIGRTDLHIGSVREGVGGAIVAHSDAMREILHKVTRFARFPFPVLVSGESGTGKEGIARALHEQGPRASGPFVAVNAGSFPAELIESELFGHEKGAFTGAVGVRRGVFEQANGGTLFLDEIGELPLSLQARLLRVLETGEIRRVGGEQVLRIDTRLVCATHRNLAQCVQEGRFRNDLLFRIVQLSIALPPLRDRPSDIPPLAEHFLGLLHSQVGARSLAEGALERLREHDWPGNVRELRNVIQAAAVLSGRVIDRIDIEQALARMPRTGGPPARLLGNSVSEALERYGGNLSATARALGIPRSTLRDRLRSERQQGRSAAS